MPELLAKSVRIAFRNMCSGIYLGAIRDMFESEGFAPDLDHNPTVSGDRRSLVEQYHAAIRWDDPGQVARVLKVYSRALRGHGLAVDSADSRWASDAEQLIRELTDQGFRVDDHGNILFPAGQLDRGVTLDGYALLSDPDHLARRIERMETAVLKDPDAAIGDAKELVESVCKMILEEGGESPDKNLNLPALYKKTSKLLRLDVESVPASAKGSAAAHQVLRSLAAAVQGMAELRNQIGTGHGRTRRSPAEARHARLAVGSSKTLVIFLLDTWDIRRQNS